MTMDTLQSSMMPKVFQSSIQRLCSIELNESVFIVSVEPLVTATTTTSLKVLCLRGLLRSKQLDFHAISSLGVLMISCPLVGNTLLP
jgi:hypothetical protein